MTDTTVQPWCTGLHLLIGALAVELHGAEPGVWASRIHQGRCIALSLLEDGRKVVRISRDTRPMTPSAWDRWNGEVRILRQHLGIAHYDERPVPSQSTEKFFTEPIRVTA